jgi:hypothetical protein
MRAINFAVPYYVISMGQPTCLLTEIKTPANVINGSPRLAAELSEEGQTTCLSRLRHQRHGPEPRLLFHDQTHRPRAPKIYRESKRLKAM